MRESLKPRTSHSILSPIARARSQLRIWMFETREEPMKFRPLQDRVLIRRIDEEEKTAGGIIVPDM